MEKYIYRGGSVCVRIQRFTCGNYSIALIPVGDYDSEFGSFFQWKTKRDEGNLRNSKQNLGTQPLLS